MALTWKLLIKLLSFVTWEPPNDFRKKFCRCRFNFSDKADQFFKRLHGPIFQRVDKNDCDIKLNYEFLILMKKDH